MKSTAITVIGFILFLLGFTALFLSLVGINLVILSPLESLGALPAFLLKIIMIVLGFVLIYVSKTKN